MGARRLRGRDLDAVHVDLPRPRLLAAREQLGAGGADADLLRACRRRDRRAVVVAGRQGRVEEAGGVGASASAGAGLACRPRERSRRLRRQRLVDAARDLGALDERRRSHDLILQRREALVRGARVPCTSGVWASWTSSPISTIALVTARNCVSSSAFALASSAAALAPGAPLEPADPEPDERDAEDEGEEPPGPGATVRRAVAARAAPARGVPRAGT
ncbi:MAG: hypothetical protein R3C15_04600 [Thermoleophilia bacterium]